MSTQPTNDLLSVAEGPHWRDGSTLASTQWLWLLGLLPAAVASVVWMGWPALRVLALAGGTAVACDALAQRVAPTRDYTANCAFVLHGNQGLGYSDVFHGRSDDPDGSGFDDNSFFTNDAPYVLLAEGDRDLYLADLGLAFSGSAGEIDVFIDDGMIWVSWPKKSSGVPSEVSEETIRAVVQAKGRIDIRDSPSSQ